MPAAQVAVVVGHGEEVVDVALGRGGGRRTSLVEQGRWEVAREVESREWELHLSLDLRRRTKRVSSRRTGGERVPTLSLKGPLNEKRLRWMTRMGGSRESVSLLDAFRFVLQRGQNLEGEEGISIAPGTSREDAHQASSLSRISSRTNALMQSSRLAFVSPRPEGMGIERGMKVCEG